LSAPPRRDGVNVPVVIVAFVASVAVAVLVLYAAGVIFPAGPEPVRVRVALEPVAQGLEQPVGLLGTGDGSGRLYVLEQAGRVRVVEPDGSLAAAPLLDIRANVLAGGERGLLGMALHPAADRNGRFFVTYSRRPDGATVLSELRMGEGTVDHSSERVLLEVEQPFDTHKAGNLLFDAEGMLLMGVGDGGGPGDPFGRALDPGSLLGKLLRLDVDSGDPYGIPPGNGWAAVEGARGEVHAIGLRNPWRFSFEPESDRLIIGDVGAKEWEEINVLTPGRTQASFGWSSMEGPDCFKVAGCQPWAHLPAAIAYRHVEPDGAHCAVIGGHTYRGGREPALAGVYLYGDLCSGTIWGVRAADILRQGVTPVRVGRVDPSWGLLHSFGEDDAGELYAVTSGGYLLRIRDAEGAMASARG
jgi:glucose/arabinose dehydrogenase